MKQLSSTSNNPIIDLFIDITKEICPLTFVKTKLLIEKMHPGQIAQIRLSGVEPIKNVPQSIIELGHTILSLEPESPMVTNSSVQILIVQKNC